MGLTLPPKHRIDAEALYVSAVDTAWDRPRIEAELDELGDQWDTHPVVRYFAGKTRYDVDAEGVRSYLNPGAWIWVLRRLSTRDYARLCDMRGRGQHTERFDEAAKLCVLEVRDAGGYKVRHAGGELSEACAWDLLRMFSNQVGVTREVIPNLLYELGVASWRYSQGLQDSEKKPSG